MDFVDLMKLLAVAITTFISYRLLVRERQDKTKGHYTRPAWNFFLKKIYAESVIRRKQKADKLRAIHENETKYENESPKVLVNEESSDSQLISGSDSKGNSILLKFTRLRHRVAEIWFIIRLENGQVYTLPDHPNTKITNATPRIFEGSGLKLEYLIPYSRWRITYSGMLRRGVVQEETVTEKDLFYTRVNFMWTTVSEPLFWPHDWSPKLIATSLATEKWRDGKWMQMITKKDSGGYDQYGACHGEIKIYQNDLASYLNGFLPKVETFELNLPGIRQRRWGPCKNHHLHRSAVLIGSIIDGCAFEVGAFSGKYGATHSQFGNIRYPNGRVTPIDATDFNLAALGENQNSLPEATIVEIKADSRKFTIVVNFKNNSKILLTGGTQKNSWNTFVIPIGIKFDGQAGFGYAIFWYPKTMKEKVFDIQEIPTTIKRIFNIAYVPSIDKQVVEFTDKEAESVLVSGGKGSSLAVLQTIQQSKGKDYLDKRERGHRILDALVDQASPKPLKRSIRVQTLLKEKDQLSKSGTSETTESIAKAIFPDPNDVDFPDYQVPQGFIVSVSANDLHVSQHPSIKLALNELENIAYEKSSGDLKNACRNVQNAFESSSLNDELKKMIAKRLNDINSDKSSRFAVRSSGVTEDSEESSAAGQNETFLGLRNNEEVFVSIIKCWASLYSFQSVLYRKQHIQPVISSMAVIVQRMVDAEAAGVLFSRHPLNGDPSVIVITANFGLGESVVSGNADPDTFYIKRSFKDHVEYIGAKPGAKKVLIEMDDESTREIQVDENKRKQLCLLQETALDLAQLGIVMEKFFGTPRDIEFAVTKDKKVYLLQSRPITALNSFTDYEIIHENDSAVMSVNDIVTKGNVGEVVQGPCSMLFQSAFLFEKILSDDIIGKGKFSGLYKKFFPMSHHHLFMDVTNMYLGNLGKEISMSDRIMTLAVFGTDLYEKYPELEGIAKHLNSFKKDNAFSPLKIMYRSIFQVGKHMAILDKTRDKLSKQFSKENLSKLTTSTDIFHFFEHGLIDFEIACVSHMIASRNSSIYQSFLFSSLIGKSKKLTTQHQADIALILGSINDVESATIPEMIKEIAGRIMLINKHEEFLELDSKQGVEWLKVNVPSAHILFQTFMKRHGHRSINELDYISRPWNMDPEKIIDMIKSNLKTADNNLAYTGGHSKFLTDGEIAEKVKSPMGVIARFFFHKLLPRTKRGVQLREEAKSKLVFCSNEVRRSLFYLGEKMVNEGFLPDKDLIFHLAFNEIKDLLKTRDGKFVAKAIRRSKVFLKMKDIKFAELNFGVRQPLKVNANTENVVKGDVLVKGVPVCGGTITATACVCRSFEDVHLIKKGDILITYGTDIAWSPYFPILNGICTEIGGLISHGAVVAREYGLPCIVGATSATDVIKHGQLITLSADDGRITAAL